MGNKARTKQRSDFWWRIVFGALGLSIGLFGVSAILRGFGL